MCRSFLKVVEEWFTDNLDEVVIERWKNAVMTKSDDSLAQLMDLCSNYSDYINVDLTGFGYRPIHYASAYNNIAAVEYLIEKGAKVDKANAWGYQPLHLCVPKGYSRVAELLINRGGSSVVNAQNCYGAAALHYAADTGRKDIVDMLLKHDANPDLKQDLGKTPWKLADDKRLEQADVENNIFTPIATKLKFAQAPSNNVDDSKLLRSRYWYWVLISTLSLLVGLVYYYIFQTIMIDYPWIPLLLWLNVIYLIHLLGTNYNHHSISAILAEHWELSSYQLSVILSFRCACLTYLVGLCSAHSSDREESLVYFVSVLALLSILAFPIHKGHFRIFHKATGILPSSVSKNVQAFMHYCLIIVISSTSLYLYIAYNVADTICMVLLMVYFAFMILFLVAMKCKLSCSIVIEALSFFCVELTLFKSLMNKKIYSEILKI